MFSTDATVVDLTAWLCQQQRNSFSLNTFDPWLVEATMWSLWMLGGADYIVNLYFQMCCIFSFQMNDSMTCSEIWHFGAKKLTTQLPHKLSPGPGGYIIVVTRGRVAWYRLRRKEQCVKTGPVTFPPVPPCCTIPASTIHVVLWVVFSESYHFRSYLYSNSQNPGSGECDPEVLPYISLYLWWWTMDSYIPINKGDCINIWTAISERSETNAKGAIWLRPTKDHCLLKQTNKQQFSYLFQPGENYARNFKTIFSAEYAILQGK